MSSVKTTISPIVLFVYNRVWHTKQVVESLLKNLEAQHSQLFIFSDGPKKDHKSTSSVNEVRNYIKTIKGFKHVAIYESKTNKGLADSIISGVTKIVNKYGKIIVLEDDTMVSPYFLRYMNDALTLYEKEPKVACIHGWTFNISDLHETFFLKGADCWGWATWKRAWNIFEIDAAKLLHQLETQKLTYEFDYNGVYPYTQMLQDQIQRNHSWAIRWHASAFLKNMLCLYPGKSLVKNIGLDNSGTNCGRHTSGLYNTALGLDAINLKKLRPFENVNSKNKIINYIRTFQDKSELYQRNSNIKKIIRFCWRFTPKYLKKALLKLADKYVPLHQMRGAVGSSVEWNGNYTWEEAYKLCAGYNASNILDKCKSALLKVKNGEAIYERDSVVFDKIEYSWPLLASLMWIAAQNNNKLNVIDFGGSLGSTYYQNRKFLNNLTKLNWNIIEQENFVKCGKENFADQNLHFFHTIKESIKLYKPNVIILSSVLPYLEDPYEFIGDIMKLNIQHIIVDRTAFIKCQDRVTVQTVREPIYNASYPAWFFNEHKFIAAFESKYVLKEEWTSLGGRFLINKPTEEAVYKGYLFCKK